jgi:hypothetical protein
VEVECFALSPFVAGPLNGGSESRTLVVDIAHVTYAADPLVYIPVAIACRLYV